MDEHDSGFILFYMAFLLSLIDIFFFFFLDEILLLLLISFLINFGLDIVLGKDNFKNEGIFYFYDEL